MGSRDRAFVFELCAAVLLFGNCDLVVGKVIISQQSLLEGSLVSWSQSVTKSLSHSFINYVIILSGHDGFHGVL